MSTKSNAVPNLSALTDDQLADHEPTDDAGKQELARELRRRADELTVAEHIAQAQQRRQDAQDRAEYDQWCVKTVDDLKDGIDPINQGWERGDRIMLEFVRWFYAQSELLTAHAGTAAAVNPGADHSPAVTDLKRTIGDILESRIKGVPRGTGYGVNDIPTFSGRLGHLANATHSAARLHLAKNRK